MILQNESPQFVGATEGNKSIQYDYYSNNNQTAFTKLRKKLIRLGHKISKSCYESKDSSLIVDQALAEIKKIRSSLYEK